jgi:co-chaperonin GroES (HSP10)
MLDDDDYLEDFEITPNWFEGFVFPWRMLVVPVRPPQKSKGGIVIATQTQTNFEYLNYIGKVVAVGELAGKHKRFTGRDDGSAWRGAPEIGDYVIYGKYSGAGQKMKYKGVTLIPLNDDEILISKVNPADFSVNI